MILKVTNSKEECNIDVYKISLFNFGQKEYHPFIAANKWSSVELDVTDETPRGFIRQIIKNTKVIPIYDVNNISVKMMQIFCEIYPDYSSKIRMLFMKDRSSFVSFIYSLGESCV